MLWVFNVISHSKTPKCGLGIHISLLIINLAGNFCHNVIPASGTSSVCQVLTTSKSLSLVFISQTCYCNTKYCLVTVTVVLLNLGLCKYCVFLITVFLLI